MDIDMSVQDVIAEKVVEIATGFFWGKERGMHSLESVQVSVY